MGYSITIICAVFLATLPHLKATSEPSETIPIGSWTYYAHGTKGGKVTILDKRRILIKNFNYDGKGPEAWFQIGLFKTGPETIPLPCANNRRQPIIPDDKGGCSKKPGSYSNANLILTIPDNYEWADIDYVGLFCYKYQHLFGFIKIPQLEPYNRLESSYKRVDACIEEHERILMDSTSPVTCKLEKPSDTSGGNFP